MALVALALIALAAAQVGRNGTAVREDLDIPRSDRTAGWAAAAALAGVPLFEPGEPGQNAGQPQILVRGVAGDPTRPVQARYANGLVLHQAHRDVIPAPEDENEFIEIRGADEAWRGEASGVEYLLVRRGSTLVILSGLPAERLDQAAASLRPISSSGTDVPSPLVVSEPTPESSAAAPARITESGYLNPVIDTDFADPSLLRASDGWTYAYSTEQLTIERMAHIQVARSRDLVRWELLPDALPTKPAWASTTRDFWAPGAIEADGAFFLYFAALHDSRDGMCLGVAKSAAPGGPFEDSGQPLQCGDGFVNIDPMPFDDPDGGRRLLYWGSAGSPILAQELAPDRLSFLPGSEPVEVMQRHALQPYEGLVEAPWIVRREGRYYLFYSGDLCCDPDAPAYAVMIARSQSALGPFEAPSDLTGEWGSNVILRLSDRWDAPGHNAVVTDDAGRDWLAYHAIDPEGRFQPGIDAVRRPMLLDPIAWSDGWPSIEGSQPSQAEVTRPVMPSS